MAEQQGFEPWRHFHALRDFESRLFDQLEYSSVWPGSLYQPQVRKSSIWLFFHHFDDLHHLLLDTLAVLPFVGPQTVGAILNAVFRVCKITTAFIPQCIQGAIAEQAAEGIRICPGMAGKIFTLSMLKKIVVCHIYLLRFMLQ